MKILVLSLAFVLTASCGGGSEPAGHEHEPGGHADMPSTDAFGSAADPDDADRTVQVETLDALEFDPDQLTVEAGETVSFEVKNTGSTAHEFVLGNEAYQGAHGSDMGGMEHSDGNGVFLEPGASGTVTWTFTGSDDVLYACHVNGHYKAGMFGRIKVR